MPPVRTLVVSHSAEASGAPIALLRIMKACVANGTVKPVFIVREGGDLVPEFESLGPVILMSARVESGAAKVASKFPFGGAAEMTIEGVAARCLRYVVRRHKIRLAYINTATQNAFAGVLGHSGLPVVTHVHELERVLRKTIGGAGIEAVVNQSQILLAGSHGIRKMLIAHGADDTQIVHVPLPIANGDDAALPIEERASIRRDVFKVDDDTALVVACGSPSWTKGPDVFLQVARHTIGNAATGTQVAFRWLGGTLPNAAMTTLIDDIDRLGLEKRVRVIPHTPNAAQLLAAADILISTSREDSGPLVALEAAAQGCPVVCFENAGGAAELASSGGAVAVPYLDAAAMAAAVCALIDSPAQRTMLGDAGRRIVSATNHPENVAKAVAMAVSRCVTEPNGVGRETGRA